MKIFFDQIKDNIFTYFAILTTANFCGHKVDTQNDMELHYLFKTSVLYRKPIE
jgi:hypothetical protein